MTKPIEPEHSTKKEMFHAAIEYFSARQNEV